MSSRKPYTGPRRGLVIGIDVGTTFSGVSYSILDPGAVPIIQGVNRYPSQEKVGGEAKIPSIMLYDSSGRVRAVGADALTGSNIELARDENWTKVEWFKLHLRPRSKGTDDSIPGLPRGKSVEKVFGDFLGYLYQCTRTYIMETHAGGHELWQSFESQARFVLTHPNGWEGAQQAQMRRAAVHGGLIPDTPEGHARISFVTEGEASLHFCIGKHYAADALKSGEGVIILDAGGGTVDLSAYYMKEADQLEEIAPATSYFQGSVYVSRRARVFLENKLRNSQYCSTEDIDLITEHFDKSTKLAFKDAKQDAFIRFGTSRDTDASVGIKFGQLKLQGSDMVSLFEPGIAVMEKAIQEQISAAHVPVTFILLVGGFSASQWLFESLETRFRRKKVRLCRPDGHLGKAVPDGAVSFFLDNCLSVRVARTTLGIGLSVVYDPGRQDHRLRFRHVVTTPAGAKLLRNSYKVILAKGTRVSEKTPPFRHFLKADVPSGVNVPATVDIVAYRGDDPKPKWVDIESGLFSKVCTIKADISSVLRTLPTLTMANGTRYMHLECSIELSFGSTEYKARLVWEENGKRKEGTAQLVYD